ncbi:hypothetical protein [Nocardiopsis synnemataformans]|uniref:hypothetical protein n=1 Tax=Nocardiopsis synnemataformans TaxID=61305 RepID=UPI003EBFF716
MTAQETLLPALAGLGADRPDRPDRADRPGRRAGAAGPGRLDRLIATRETMGNVLLLAGPGLGGLLVGLPVAGAVLAVLAGVTAIAALVAPVFRSLDDPRARESASPSERPPRSSERTPTGLALANTLPCAPNARAVEEPPADR